MGIFKIVEITNKKGEKEKAIEFDFSPIKNWWKKFWDGETLVIDDRENYHGTSRWAEQDEADEIIKNENVDIKISQHSRPHTHVFDNRGICYQCGYHMRGIESEAKKPSVEERVKMLEDIGIEIQLPEGESVEVAIDTTSFDNPEVKETSDLDSIEITEGFRLILDDIFAKNKEIDAQAVAINTFYKTLKGVDDRLIVLKYLYETIGEMEDMKRLKYMQAFTAADMKDGSDLIDAYLMNNINEALLVLTQLW